MLKWHSETYIILAQTPDLIQDADDLWETDNIPSIRSELRKQILGWATINCQMFQDGDLVFPPERADTEEPEIVT
jgi:hypothetical protein